MVSFKKFSNASSRTSLICLPVKSNVTKVLENGRIPYASAMLNEPLSMSVRQPPAFWIAKLASGTLKRKPKMAQHELVQLGTELGITNNGTIGTLTLWDQLTYATTQLSLHCMFTALNRHISTLSTIVAHVIIRNCNFHLYLFIGFI